MKKRSTFKILICLGVCIVSLLCLGVCASASEGATVSEGGSVFDEIYAIVTENSADILSLLSFAASITVALFYKYALSPLIKGGLEKITSGVKTISGESTKGYEALCEAQERLSQRSTEIEQTLLTLNERVGKISEGERERVEKSLLTVIGAQVNMLNEIFQSSALPVYQKEAVGNMINEMKSELAKNEARDEKE